MSALLFFDIDGTLLTLDDRHFIPDSAKEALGEARANGHRIFINTGRVKTAIDRELLEFGFDGLVCGCGTYIEYGGQELFHRSIPQKTCREYARILKESGFQAVYEGKERLFLFGDHENVPFFKFIYAYFTKNSEYPIERPEHPEFGFDKFTAVRMPDSDMETFHSVFDREFTMMPHTDRVYEMVPRGFSKATGMQFLMDRLGVSVEDCYAFGDSVNDMEMLRFAGHAVAMGNAPEEVRGIAEYCTTEVMEDGIRGALLHYGLI